MSRIRTIPGMAAAIALAAFTTACTVGPTYHAADVPVPPAYGEPTAPAATAPAVEPVAWWTQFGDAELTSLVTRALQDSPDVRIAAVRIREARLQEAIARSQGKPTVDATADANHVKFSKNAGFSSLASLFGGGGGAGGATGGAAGGTSTSGIALPGNGITTYSVGFDASWEIDVFGGVRRSVEAARARTDAAVWNGRDAAVMIAAEIAQSYWALRLDQAQIQVIQDEIARQSRALEIAGNTAKAGLVPPIDVTRQRSQITSNQARIQPLRADIDQRIHALAILLGQAPSALNNEFAVESLPPLNPVPAVPAGLPSDLLRRRPDIRAAERNLAASTADIGVAVADLYPRFSLTGMAQLISTSLSTLFQGDSVQLTGTGSAQFPILDWGRRRATVRTREAQRDEAYLQYRATVLGALRDVEDALAQLAAEQQRHVALTQAVTDAGISVHAVDAQYRAGLVAQDSLLNTQTQLLQAREQLAQSDAQLRQMTAALYKALGGGWSETSATVAER
ncbi:efflux transporter outer membrane subunit [Sphingomonas bacterium]|uniref:efflux transporter outer membrane subunit n=1 Tax=Sphingomonas bacterium TaxID=1895847 RepID=UPI0020C6D0C3|nr:efflux transporter outer membrane subunit [Sphingomonas bacterium]